MGLIRDTAELEPKTREAVERGIAALKALGIRHWVNETYRMQITQDAYYAQGREPVGAVNAKRRGAGLWLITEAENKTVVTNAKKSKHTERKAVDIYPMTAKGEPWYKAPKSEFDKIAGVMKMFDLEWGGDWTNPKTGASGWDCPHYQRKE